MLTSRPQRQGPESVGGVHLRDDRGVPLADDASLDLQAGRQLTVLDGEVTGQHPEVLDGLQRLSRPLSSLMATSTWVRTTDPVASASGSETSRLSPLAQVISASGSRVMSAVA